MTDRIEVPRDLLEALFNADSVEQHQGIERELRALLAAGPVVERQEINELGAMRRLTEDSCNELVKRCMEHKEERDSLQATIAQQAQRIADLDISHDRAYRNGLQRGFNLGENGQIEQYRKEFAAYQREILAAKTEPCVPVVERQEPVAWPKLEAPAMVGCTRFSKGVSSRLVVEAAQRHHEYEVTPEKEALRIGRAYEFLVKLHAIAEQPAPVAVALLSEAREWLGDGKYSDGLSRELWTPAYAALIDKIDGHLDKVKELNQ